MKTVFDTVFAFLIGFLTEEGFFFLFFCLFLSKHHFDVLEDIVDL